MDELDQSIEVLDEIILKMSGQTLSNLKYAMSVYLYFNKRMDYPPVDDAKVNAYEREVEAKCLSIMLRERLFAQDMRKVTGIMAMVGDIERLGDHAQDVLEFSLKLQNDKMDSQNIKSLTQFVMDMVEDAFKSYINRDQKLAQSVIDRDDYVDKKYADTIDYLIEADSSKEISSSFAIYTTLVVKYLERIADHATNIAEWVIYIMTGYYKDAQIV
jgi:phosphate transport system protein